jgi:hypothetical protein
LLCNPFTSVSAPVHMYAMRQVSRKRVFTEDMEVVAVCDSNCDTTGIGGLVDSVGCKWRLEVFVSIHKLGIPDSKCSEGAEMVNGVDGLNTRLPFSECSLMN